MRLCTVPGMDSSAASAPVGAVVRASRAPPSISDSGNLLDEQRVPLGPLEDPWSAGPRAFDDRQELGDQVGALVLGQRLELDERRPVGELVLRPRLERPRRGVGSGRSVMRNT